MDNYEDFKKYAENSENYKKWRKIHAQPFGDIFEKAFSDNSEAQMCLTSALIDISERNFTKGITKLKMLDPLCVNEQDITSLDYFKGLCYEFLCDEDNMDAFYKKVLDSSVKPEVILQFSPYYRSGKMAQGVAECSKSLYYYTKAMELYNNRILSKASREKAAQIVYDIGTVLMFTHRYDDALYFLDLSEKYCKDKNESRDYIRAVLFAILGKREESSRIRDGLSPFLKRNCIVITENIFNATDPHYFVVPQKRRGYNSFWKTMEENKEVFFGAITDGKIQDVENIISEALTKLFKFAKRRVECRLIANRDKILVKFKNYFIKTLEAEQNALLELRKNKMQEWDFISVSEFEENY